MTAIDDDGGGTVRPMTTRVAIGVTVAVSLVHLAALLRNRDLLADLTQVLLMPALAAYLALTAGPGRRERLLRLLLVALGFSWLGDAVPRLLEGDAGFLAMVGFFLVAQIVLIVAFWPFRRASVAVRRPWVLTVYAAALIGLVALCGEQAGPLLGPVVVYGLCLFSMSVLATGVSRTVAVGGLVFLVSDSLIALRAFAPDVQIPAMGFWVMLTYISAQALIAVGVLRLVGASVLGGVRRASAPEPARA